MSMTTTMMKAANQWATRPHDERFWTLAEAAKACQAYRDSASVVSLDYSLVRAEAQGDDLFLRGKRGAPAQMTHYFFGQLASKVKAPAKYLRQLPPTLAAQNLNHGLKERGETGDKGRLLVHENGSLLARAALGDRYVWLWNAEVMQRAQALEAKGWRPPPAFPVRNDPRARPATEADIIDSAKVGCPIHVGDLIAPAGIYASDHDAFLFLVNDHVRIDDGTPEGLIRFILLWNSEVGDRSFGGMFGLFKGACGNHIMWGVSDRVEFRMTHTGRVRTKAFNQLGRWLHDYGTMSALPQENTIRQAKAKVLGKGRVEVLDTVGKVARKARLPLPNTLLETAYEHAERHEERYAAEPNTLWGMVQGLTAVGRRSYADSRTSIDRAAGKLIDAVL